MIERYHCISFPRRSLEVDEYVLVSIVEELIG
jgi:hypothetical protein